MEPGLATQDRFRAPLRHTRRGMPDRTGPCLRGSAGLVRQVNGLQGDLLEDGEKRIGGQPGCNRLAVLVPGIAIGVGGIRGDRWFRSVTAHPGIGARPALGTRESV